MSQKEKTLRKIERLELHAYCLQAKVAGQPHPSPTNTIPIRRPAMVALAERLLAKAELKRKGLAITEAARKRESEDREWNRDVRQIGNRRARRAGAR